MYRHPGMPTQQQQQQQQQQHPAYSHYSSGYPPQMHPQMMSQMHPHAQHPHSYMYGHHPGQTMMPMMPQPQQPQPILKKNKKLKDPNAPKKASTAFMLWSLASRPRIREQAPELGFADIGKKLGEEWGLLDEKSKDHWQRQAAKDRERYEREQSAYLKSAAYSHWLEQSSALSGKRRRRKDPNAPKQPLTAYVIFSNEVRDQVINENPDANFGEIGKIIGAKWRALVSEDRKPYEERANSERDRYNRDLEEYRRSQGIYEPLHHHHHQQQQQQQQKQPTVAHHHPMYPMDDLFDDDEGLGDESVD